MTVRRTQQLAALVNGPPQRTGIVYEEREEIITTGRFDNQVLSYIDTGARWALGLRVTV